MAKNEIIKPRNFGTTSLTLRYLPTGIEHCIDRSLFERNLEHQCKDYEWIAGSKEDEKWFKTLQDNFGRRNISDSKRYLDKYFTRDKEFDFGKVPIQPV